MDPKIFRAYDIRGRYPGEINNETVGQIVSSFISSQNSKLKTKKLGVVVGHDARISSPALYKSVLNSLKDRRYKVEAAGLITTPMMYFLVSDLKADYGIMVTASHNPKEYNGLKVVGRGAKPISGIEIYKSINSKIKSQKHNQKS